jgi:hypothetical protein
LSAVPVTLRLVRKSELDKVVAATAMHPAQLDLATAESS